MAGGPDDRGIGCFYLIARRTASWWPWIRLWRWEPKGKRGGRVRGKPDGWRGHRCYWLHPQEKESSWPNTER